MKRTITTTAVNAWLIVRGFEVDAHWPDGITKLIIELDRHGRFTAA